MNSKRLLSVLDKFFAGTASEKERKDLDAWYQSELHNEVDWYSSTDNEEQAVKERILNQIKRSIKHSSRQRRLLRYRQNWIRAAIVTAIVFTSLYFFFFWRSTLSANKLTASVTAPLQSGANRYVVLPDSSIAILHSGSEISYDYHSKNRKIILTGEAYFDVRHNTDRPFVIYTGDIVTTVLGTAFNIQAYTGKKVTVSVTRGRVKVENGKKAQTILLPNQQIVFDKHKDSYRMNQIVSDSTISWTHSDMNFDGITYGQLAQKLETRYGMKITFFNRSTSTRQISGKFDGTESLRQVLDIITTTMSSRYTVKDNEIIIFDLDATSY